MHTRDNLVSRFFKNFGHKLSRFTPWLIGLVVFLIVLRLALPYIVKSYVNHSLNKKTSSYTGQIGDVGISLWRGAYQINHINISKRTGQVQEPFFAADVLDLSIEWKELFHGAVVGEIVMTQPRLNFVQGPTPEQSQAGEDSRWDQMLEGLFPFKLNRLEIHGGQIHFQNHFSKPPVDIYFNELAVTATNLSNSRDLKMRLPAGVAANAKTLGNGTMDFHLQLNPLAASPEFELTAAMTNVDLVALNDFMQAYGKFDVAHGVFATFISVATREKAYEGYVKVFFDNLDVFQWEKEKKKNVLQIFWQAVVGAVTTVFKNQPNDQLATKVPISGTYAGSSVGVWTAVATLLQNAFIHALVPKLDTPVTTGDVDKKIKEENITPPPAAENPPNQK